MENCVAFGKGLQDDARRCKLAPGACSSCELAMRYLTLFFAAALLTSHAFAQEEMKIEGAAYLHELACAKGLSSSDCTLAFFIQGPVAKTLWEGIKASAVREDCTGGLEKIAGGLHCLKYDDGTYACDFGFDFTRQNFSGSGEGC
jgi:hypothetical protein